MHKGLSVHFCAHDVTACFQRSFSVMLGKIFIARYREKGSQIAQRR